VRVGHVGRHAGGRRPLPNPPTLRPAVNDGERFEMVAVWAEG
jgi:hypothetical protein